MALDSRFAQIVMERNVAVTNATPTEVTSMPTGPRTPQIFFGRDAELAQIIHMIFTNIGSHPARIAILGPGGYGKTTLSNAVLTHDRVREHYGAARYFVACESISSSGALLIELGKVLGVLKGPSDSLWSRIRTSLEAKECIICFDNFETPWDQAGDTRHSVEGILSGVTELGRVTVLITMRGTERPSETQWTKPPLAPLQTLNYHAAKEIWMHIADIYDDHAEELIKAVDYVPLAVNLLAHLSQVTPPALLWKDWNSRQTRVVQRGQAHRLSNLEYSIQLSIDSGRMMANPRAKDLLGVLSMLPDGMHIQKLDKFHEILGDIEITTCLQVLQQCGLINLSGERYHPHPIIRHFCNHHGLISPKYKGSLEDFYLTLASISLWHAEPQQYAEMVLEVNNTKAVLLGLIESNYEDHQRIINAIIPFTELHRNIGDLSDKLISQVVQFLQQNHGTASSLIMCFRAWSLLYVYADDLNIATQKLKEAERICLSHGNTYDLSYASILNDLGDIYFAQGASNEAEGLFQKALKLWEAANNISGQGESHEKLGGIYLQMRNYSEAEASFQKALNFSKAADDILCQSRVYSGLADTYVQLGKLDEAEGHISKPWRLIRLSTVSLAKEMIIPDLEIYI
ncbi:P-loop containing nucleoside triphosphate hydrolase protein [Multifurca ochricompacta]|uniref:P-loop containing nucleoside triphosphate hydrolase protein n=1 Tax=Multifurca ochricompacta TaxID=376703 RepID=A0AAD4LXE1_9AGAM|nr:P-loop containing nucleoside triphosphate hydrolase protein [Multifurca ochricompacta]